MAEPSKNVGKWNNARQAMEVWWEMLRTLRAGTDAMRNANVKYLPKDWAEQQRPERYTERLMRTFLFEAYDAAIERIAGAPFAKPIKVTPENLPDTLDLIEQDADRCGTSLTSFTRQLLDDKADRSFCLFLVDHVPQPERPAGAEPLRQDEEEALGMRPYFVRIDPDNIVGWRSVVEAGRERLTELRIRERITEPQDDFSERTIDRVTVWTDAKVAVWEHVQSTTSTDPSEVEVVRQLHAAGHVLKSTKPNGFPGGRIPYVLSGKITSKPPLLGLAWLNVNHWQSSSQQNNILHYGRAPLLALSGMSREEAEKRVQLGAGAVLYSSDSDFTAEYVEPNGAAIGSGEKDLEKIEQRMRSLADEPLMETSGPESATGELTADSKRQSKAQRWVEELEWALQEGYSLAAEWRKTTLPEDFKAAIWRGFQMTEKSQTDMSTLEAARGRKDLSRETYLKEIQRRDVIDRDLDIDEELERIEEEGESLAEMLPPPPVPGQNPDGEPPPDAPGQPPQDSKQKPPTNKERAA